MINKAKLRQITGLNVHVTEVYMYVRSFLKGFFNVLEVFCHGSNLEDWHIDGVIQEASELKDDDATQAQAQVDYPIVTQITLELIIHAATLA